MIENIGTTLNNVTMRGLGFFTQPLLRLTRGKLWLQVLVGMILGIGTGLALSPDTGWVERPTALATGEWLALPGNLFLIFIQMIVVPLILSSIIRGLSSATDIQQLKSTGIWLAAYFLSTTLVAVVIGIVLTSNQIREHMGRLRALRGQLIAQGISVDAHGDVLIHCGCRRRSLKSPSPPRERWRASAIPAMAGSASTCRWRRRAVHRLRRRYSTTGSGSSATPNRARTAS